MTTNTINWGQITGPNNFLPPSPTTICDPFDDIDDVNIVNSPPPLPTTAAANPPLRAARPSRCQPAETLHARLDTTMRILLLRLCIRDAELYSRASRKTFWKKVQKDLCEETGQDHTTLARLVANLVKRRRECKDASVPRYSKNLSQNCYGHYKHGIRLGGVSNQ
ncbi:hypothetical protein GMDG_07031 [Pseudogymnoascus destructans 20631-21]|uniref:Uncharacterized protein n=1 Tax=Pseudogymnoascus destructans (strain ATCC MYA-4855 / 20631-21) TaxID=658429 RepID=L8FV16_PSED2|nr:hypothetical protein GMDG_07031 [Pseudogymnoascus destructans 20631-21]